MEDQATIFKKVQARFPVVWSHQVEWHDLDAARHVNNVSYVRWCESARVEYFHALGFDIMSNGRPGVILGYQDCKYIYQVSLPDTVHIGIRAKKIEEDRVELYAELYSEKHQRIVATHHARMVCFDYGSQAKCPWPEAWLAQMTTLEAQVPSL